MTPLIYEYEMTIPASTSVSELKTQLVSRCGLPEPQQLLSTMCGRLISGGFTIADNCGTSSAVRCIWIAVRLWRLAGPNSLRIAREIHPKSHARTCEHCSKGCKSVTCHRNGPKLGPAAPKVANPSLATETAQSSARFVSIIALSTLPCVSGPQSHGPPRSEARWACRPALKPDGHAVPMSR